MLSAPSPTPMMISIAIVSSIAILQLDTYRGRNFRYRPALLFGRCAASARRRPLTAAGQSRHSDFRVANHWLRPVTYFGIQTRVKARSVYLQTVGQRAFMLFIRMLFARVIYIIILWFRLKIQAASGRNTSIRHEIKNVQPIGLTKTGFNQ